MNDIRSTFPTFASIHQGPALASCEFLRACLDETLRLSPSSFEPVWREVCPGGTTIDGHYVSEGSEVAVSLYALHRNPKYFANPDTFDPDRFMPESVAAEPTLKKPKFDYFPASRANTKFPISPSALSPNSFQGMYFPASSGSKENPAFAPFLVGSSSCVGKSLAYLIMSLTLAKLMWCMDFRAVESTGQWTEGSFRHMIGSLFGGRRRNVMLQFRRREHAELTE